MTLRLEAADDADVDTGIIFMKAIGAILNDVDGTSGDFAFGRAREKLRQLNTGELGALKNYVSAYGVKTADTTDEEAKRDRTDDTAATPRERLARELDGAWKSKEQREFEDGKAS